MESLEETIRAHSDVSTIEKAAAFLSQICPKELISVNTLPVRFPSPEAFALVLWKQPRLHQTLQSCHRDMDLTSFWGPFHSKENLHFQACYFDKRLQRHCPHCEAPVLKSLRLSLMSFSV
jgi:hypothetical protein